MAEDFKIVFGNDKVSTDELVFGDDNVSMGELVFEEKQEPFGSIRYFRLNYRERVNNFLKDFLHSNVENVISNNDGDVEQVKTQIANLVEVYYQSRVEFEKHKNKLY